MKNLLISQGKKAKSALSNFVSTKKKNQVLEDYEKLILNNFSKIIKENKKDLNLAVKKKLNSLSNQLNQ
jgi:gamma-glutamyl phosphate reductase